MKELLEIISAYKQSPTPMALATIVQTAGSSYRRAGARMLVTMKGRTIGCISGGCLDQDVVLHAQEVIRSGKSTLITYDTSSDRDIILGVGLGCKGVINIQVEYVPVRAPMENGDAKRAFLDFLVDVIEQRRIGGAATVIGTTGKTGLNAGDRVMVTDLGGRNAPECRTVTAQIGIGILTGLAQSAVKKVQAGLVSQDFVHGTAQIFVETILPQRRLVILGAGHDAMPLARMAHELGWRTAVIDGRAGYATRERFPLAEDVIIARPESDWPRELFDGCTVAVVMAHHFLIDQAWLKNLIPLKLPYLGVMGPRKRAEKMLEGLREDGMNFADEELLALHNPIGLDIGADTPEQIALAILAEIQAVFGGRDGGKLKNRSGTVHLAPIPIDPVFTERLEPREACAT
jgi:xanthine dehydrogenase accessory factor